MIPQPDVTTALVMSMQGPGQSPVYMIAREKEAGIVESHRLMVLVLWQSDFETLAPALTAQADCASAYAAASRADAWLAEHFKGKMLHAAG